MLVGIFKVIVMTVLSVLYLSVCTVLPIPSSPAEKEIRILYHTSPSQFVKVGCSGFVMHSLRTHFLAKAI